MGRVNVEALTRVDDPFVRHQLDQRAVSVHPAHRGRSIGRGLIAALTRRALAGRSGVATLGVYTDNVPALATYTRLGYATGHTFVSGPVS